MLVLDVGIVVLSIYGFIAQWLLIRRSKTIGNFSVYVTAFAIFSSIFKTFYWFIEPYYLNLLIQNWLYITIHMMLVWECVKVGVFSVRKTNVFQRFWKWPFFVDYITCVTVVALFLATIILVSIKLEMPILGKILGYVATPLEVMIALPQIIANCTTKSVKGLSFTMIGCWLVNDTAKTIYFIFQGQPLPFILTGSFQIVCDLIIVAQIVYYRKTEHLRQVKEDMYLSYLMEEAKTATSV